MSSILASEEWRKAVEYTITDEDIQRQRKLVDYDEAAAHREHVQAVTTSVIRNLPRDLAEKAGRMMARHRELSVGMRT